MSGYRDEATVKCYRERPPEIEAVKWTGDNIEEIQKFADSHWLDIKMELSRNNPYLIVWEERVDVGQWLVRTDKGFRVMKDSLFHKHFEPVEGVMDDVQGFSLHITNSDVNGAD